MLPTLSGWQAARPRVSAVGGGTGRVGSLPATMGRRTIVLVSALLIAALGTLLVYMYVR